MTIPQARIVIPASNEEQRIASTVREYCEHFGARARVVVVTNGCEDGTERVVAALQERYANLVLLSISGKIGKGGAIRVGFSSGDEPLLGFTDADGSTSAREFDRLIARLGEFEADGVIGSRWLKGALMQRPQPLVRRVASRIFNGIVRLLFGLRYRDTQCGAKVFRRSAIERVFSRLEISNFAFDVDLLYQLSREGCAVIEMPIAWAESFSPSKVQLLSASLSMFLAILRLRFRDSLLAHIRFFDYFARRSLIPVRHSFRILILGPQERAAQVEAIVQRWQDEGHTVEWVRARSPLGRLRVFLWYALFGRYEYDAVVEVASGLPYFIAVFSVKPRFLVGADSLRRGFAARAYISMYHRVEKVLTSDLSDVAGTSRAVLQAIKSSGMYLAVFDRQDGNWAITFTDSSSQTRRRQQL